MCIVVPTSALPCGAEQFVRARLSWPELGYAVHIMYSVRFSTGKKPRMCCSTPALPASATLFWTYHMVLIWECKPGVVPYRN